LRKNFFGEKNIIYFSIKNFSEKLHSSYTKNLLFIFPFLLEKKAKFCANVSRNVLYVLEKDFSFPSMFPTIH